MLFTCSELALQLRQRLVPWESDSDFGFASCGLEIALVASGSGVGVLGLLKIGVLELRSRSVSKLQC